MKTIDSGKSSRESNVGLTKSKSLLSFLMSS